MSAARPPSGTFPHAFQHATCLGFSDAGGKPSGKAHFCCTSNFPHAFPHTLPATPHTPLGAAYRPAAPKGFRKVTPTGAEYGPENY
jgi:hypothetical protein